MLRVCQEAVEGVMVELGTQVLESRPVVSGSGSGGLPSCHPQPSPGTGVAGKLLSALKGVWFHRTKKMKYRRELWGQGWAPLAPLASHMLH